MADETNNTANNGEQPQSSGGPSNGSSGGTGGAPRPRYGGGGGGGGGGGFRGGPRGGSGGRPRGRNERYVPRRKVCAFCVDHVEEIDYKDVARLRRYLSERAKIEPRRKTGTCALHQRALGTAIKRARHMALLPYIGPHFR